MSEEGAKYYFGKVQEYAASGILNTMYNDQVPTPARLEIIDLPSIHEKRTRLLVINSVLSEEWSIAQNNWRRALEKKKSEDERVPTFIVIDEAHNLIPSEPRIKAEFALREQFRTIISEGRKYGLFLIIASQRPDKLDPLVLSECDNKAIMKLSSESVLELTRKLLSIDGISTKLLDQTLTFETGRGILIGKWTSNNTVPFYAAARRTVEGGRNLREEFWASPVKNPSKSLIKDQDVTPKITRSKKVIKKKVIKKQASN